MAPCIAAIATGAARQRCVSITVKRVADGLVSNWIHQHWLPGKVVSLGLPQGSFIYRQQQNCCLSVPVPASPCYLMAQALLRAGRGGDIAFDAQFRHETDMIFDPACATGPEKGPECQHRAEPAAWKRCYRGQAVDADELRRRYPDFAERIYLCRAAGLHGQDHNLLQQAGFDLARLHW